MIMLNLHTVDMHRYSLLKVHLHGSNLCVLKCQSLEKRGPKIQDYVISCNSNITSFILYSTTDYIPDACGTGMASLRSDSNFRDPCRCAFNYLTVPVEKG